jgi:hypothetical protein
LLLDITNIIIGKQPFLLLFDHCLSRHIIIFFIFFIFIVISIRIVFGLFDIDNLIENVHINIIILKVIKAHDVFTLFNGLLQLFLKIAFAFRVGTV